MRSYSVLARLVLGIGLLCVADSLPSNRRQWFYPVFDDVHQGECVHIEHTCNRVFNRSDSDSYVKFPNTRGLTLDASIAEFNDFFLALNRNISGCSLPLWSLLCYHYFPQCHPYLPLKYVVTPCREICEQARSGCEDYVEMGNLSWPEHLDCAKFNSSYEDRLCINSTAEPSLVDKALKLSVTTPQTTTPPTTTTTPLTTTGSKPLPPEPTATIEPNSTTDAPQTPSTDASDPTPSSTNSSCKYFCFAIATHVGKDILCIFQCSVTQEEGAISVQKQLVGLLETMAIHLVS